METLLPLTLRLVADGLLELGEALAKITNDPAGLLGIEAGTLACAAAMTRGDVRIEGMDPGPPDGRSEQQPKGQEQTVAGHEPGRNAPDCAARRHARRQSVPPRSR